MMLFPGQPRTDLLPNLTSGGSPYSLTNGCIMNLLSHEHGDRLARGRVYDNVATVDRIVRDTFVVMNDRGCNHLRNSHLGAQLCEPCVIRLVKLAEALQFSNGKIGGVTRALLWKLTSALVDHRDIHLADQLTEEVLNSYEKDDADFAARREAARAAATKAMREMIVSTSKFADSLSAMKSSYTKVLAAITGKKKSQPMIDDLKLAEFANLCEATEELWSYEKAKELVSTGS